MPRGRAAALSVICLLFTVAACGAARPQMASMAMAPGAATPVPAPPPLDRSLFARDPNGQISEDALQQILAAPIELALPARVGVMPIVTATDWRGPGPDFDNVPPGVAPLVSRLRHDTSFSLVTQMMPIPSGSLGMEALREAAARYRLRYIVLYREVLVRDNTLNAWAWFYATGLGLFVAPGQHHEVYGYIEATMFDVKTGLLMFTTRRAVTAASTTNLWHQDEKVDRLASDAIRKFAPDLGEDMLADLRRFATAVTAERTGATPPTSGASTPAVATGTAPTT